MLALLTQLKAGAMVQSHWTCSNVVHAGPNYKKHQPHPKTVASPSWAALWQSWKASCSVSGALPCCDWTGGRQHAADQDSSLHQQQLFAAPLLLHKLQNSLLSEEMRETRGRSTSTATVRRSLTLLTKKLTNGNPLSQQTSRQSSLWVAKMRNAPATFVASPRAASCPQR